MRVVLAILALFSCLAAVPARASWFIDANLFGEGTKLVETCTFITSPSCSQQITPFSASIGLGAMLVPEAIGITHFSQTVAGRAFGRPATASFDIEYDGNSFFGRNFAYFEADASRSCSQGVTCFTATARASASGFAVNIHPGTAGPVPEPATWAMMLAGFGLAGAAMRRGQLTASVWANSDFLKPEPLKAKYIRP